jgi:hypothetical protein
MRYGFEEAHSVYLSIAYCLVKYSEGLIKQFPHAGTGCGSPPRILCRTRSEDAADETDGFETKGSALADSTPKVIQERVLAVIVRIVRDKKATVKS